jgi:hypothetical protein
MTAHRANLLNALVLVCLSLWAVLTPAYTSYTALIPTAFGVGLLLCTPGLRVGKPAAAYIALALTLMLLLLLTVPFRTALVEANTVSALRVGTMMLTCAFAGVMVFRSIKTARRAS